MKIPSADLAISCDANWSEESIEDIWRLPEYEFGIVGSTGVILPESIVPERKKWIHLKIAVLYLVCRSNP